MRESFPRQVDKKSRGPQGKRDLEFSRRKKGQTFFHLPSLKVKGWKNIFHANGKQKKAGVAVLISDKIDLKIKITRGKDTT